MIFASNVSYWLSMRLLGTASVLASSLAVLVSGTEAEACGGTFCDAGPNLDVVDQAAETVVFVRDGAYVEAHIQIAIDPNTDAQKFAWLLPMPAVPEFQVGSQPLFDALLQGTRPSHGTNGPYCGSGDEGGSFIQSPDGGGVNKEPEAQTTSVGAFEVTVLQGGTVDGVMQWLGDNGYEQDADAAPILDSYLADGHVLVAFRLLPSADVGEVHPIVLRYLGDEPCVPLRLTAIAAQENMAVRVFMLGDERWAPLNYQHVVPNPLRFRWSYSGPEYADVITQAVDAAEGGHGFVTEYAGDAALVDDSALWAATWDADAFVAAAAIDVVQLLNDQQLANCTRNGPCFVGHPVVVGMLRKYLPAPADVAENDFYRCLSCYADQTDFPLWDGPAFANEMRDRVIAPGLHAKDLLGAWPYLTRMFTTISPHEMTLDPTFQPAPDLRDVGNVSVATVECVECEADLDAIATLADGRQIYLDDATWPAFDAGMPYAERIEEIPPKGAPIVVVDNRPLIDEALDAWNGAHECMPPDGTADTGTGGPGGTGGSEGPGIPGDDTGTSGGTQGSDGIAESADTLGRGCSCDAGAPVDPRGGFAALMLLALRRRRRA